MDFDLSGRQRHKHRIDVLDREIQLQKERNRHTEEMRKLSNSLHEWSTTVTYYEVVPSERPEGEAMRAEEV